MVFTGMMVFVSIYYMVYLKGFKANIEKFSKAKKSETIFYLLFVLFVLMVAYVLVLFFVKLNLIQTLAVLSVILIPGTVITYKALSSITIEI